MKISTSWTAEAENRRALGRATHCHFHVIGPSVVLLVNDFKKVPSLHGQPGETASETQITVNSRGRTTVALFFCTKNTTSGLKTDCPSRGKGTNKQTEKKKRSPRRGRQKFTGFFFLPNSLTATSTLISTSDACFSCVCVQYTNSKTNCSVTDSCNLHVTHAFHLFIYV